MVRPIDLTPDQNVKPWVHRAIRIPALWNSEKIYVYDKIICIRLIDVNPDQDMDLSSRAA